MDHFPEIEHVIRDETEVRERTRVEGNGKGLTAMKWREQEEVEEDEGGEETDSNEEYKSGGDDKDGEEDDEEEDTGDDEEMDEDDQEQYDQPDASQLLWSCTVCAITLNIFARDDHLYSRTHARNAKKEQHPETQSRPMDPTPLVWHCKVCDEEMNFFAQPEHLDSKHHLRMLHATVPPENGTQSNIAHTSTMPRGEDGISPIIPDPISALAESQTYEPSNIFYCITCAVEFPLSMQDQHLDNTKCCDVCGRAIHAEWMEGHLAGHEKNTDTGVGDNRNLPVDWPSAHLGHQNGLGAITGAVSQATVDGTPSSSANVYTRASTVTFTDWRRMVTRFSPPVPHTDSLDENAERKFISGIHGGGYGVSFDREDPSKPHDRNTTTAERVQKPPGAPAPHSYQPALAPQAAATASPDPHATAPEGSFYCEACNKYKSIAGRYGHEKSQKHRKNTAAWQLEQQHVPTAYRTAAQQRATVAPPAASVSRTAAAASSDDFYCAVCKKYRKVAGMEGHMKSKKHRKNAGSKPASKKSKKAPGPVPANRTSNQARTPAADAHSGKLYCEVCRKYKSPVAMEQHVKSKKHKRNVASKQPGYLVAAHPAPDAPAPVSSQLRIYNCDVCKVNTRMTTKESHLSSKVHLAKAAELSQADSKEASNSHTASPTGDEIIGATKELKEVDGQAPSFDSNQNQYTTERASRLPTVHAKLIDNLPPVTAASFVNSFWTPLPETFQCETCDMRVETRHKAFHEAKPWRCVQCAVTIHWEGMATHRSGAQHTQRQQERETVAKDNLPSFPLALPTIASHTMPPHTFFCQVCDGLVQTAERPLHATPPWRCTLCGITIHLCAKEAHLWSREHTILLNQSLQAESWTTSNTFFCDTCNDSFDTVVQEYHRSRSWECTICEITTHTDWIGQHLVSMEHAAKVPSAPVPELFYCNTCQVYFEEPHTTPEWECELCNVVTHVEWAQDHINDALHVENLQRAEELQLIGHVAAASASADTLTASPPAASQPVPPSHSL